MTATWYGLTEEEKEQAIEEARTLLTERARRGQGPITYDDLYHQLTKPPSTMFRSIGAFLGLVGEREVHAGRPLITALILRSEDHLPGPGFWVLLDEIGYDVSNKPVAWALTLLNIYAYWHRTD